VSPEAIHALISGYYKPSSPRDLRFPTDDVDRIERYFGCVVPTDFRVFRELLPGYGVEGDHLPPDEIEAVYESEIAHNPNFAKSHLPFYSVGNGDHICLSISACPNSPVLYVAHDDPTVSVLAPSFDAFLQDPDWFG